MPLVAARSIVLQAFRYSDTSKVLRLYTAEHGLRSAMAKGALRPRNRFGGLLEPFTEGTAHLYLREGRDLHTLGGFDLLVSRQALGRNLTGFAGGCLLAEMLLRHGTEEPNLPLFSLLANGLDEIVRASDAAKLSAVLGAAWRMVGLLGYAPELETCVTCGETPAPQEPARFDAEGGGIACARCRPAGRVLDACTRAELRQLAMTAPHAELVNGAMHRALLRAFLAAHIARDRPLRSLDLLLRDP